MEYFVLSNGNKIPAVGSGTNTFAKAGHDYGAAYTGDTKEVRSAIEAGTRFFDTAESYRNEEAIGNGLLESGLPREEFFISTKMQIRKDEPQGAAEAEAAIARSLAKLKTDYIDLYLIHFPRANAAENAEIWKVLEKYYKQGVLRAIGVSNFMKADLEALLATAEIRPMVNQVKCSPDNWNAEAIAYAQAEGLIPMAWGPLKFEESKREPLSAIGARYGKSWSQVLLRFQYQRGIVTIPKSHSFAHQKENLEIFDFALTDAEMAEIAAL